MLVLSRQRDETIMIGDEVEITIVDIRGDKVRIGITAPARIAVHRKEVYEAIRAENEQASRMTDGEVSSLAQGVRPGGGSKGGAIAVAPRTAGGSGGSGVSGVSGGSGGVSKAPSAGKRRRA